jgi:hypothetical protein
MQGAVSTLTGKDLGGVDPGSVKFESGGDVREGATWSGPSVEGGDYLQFTNPQGSGCSFGWVLGPIPYWGISAGHCMGLNQLNAAIRWRTTAGILNEELVWNAGYSNYNSATQNTSTNDIVGFWVPYGSTDPYPAYDPWNGLPRVRIADNPASYRTVRGTRTNKSDLVVGLQLCQSGLGLTGETCGNLQSRNASVTFVSGRKAKGLYGTNAAGCGAGDSGGPVYWVWNYAYVGDAEPTGMFTGFNSNRCYFETMEDIEAVLGHWTVNQAA